MKATGLGQGARDRARDGLGRAWARPRAGAGRGGLPVAGSRGAAGWDRAVVRENGGVESDFDFSVESRLVHGGTERAAGAPLGPPLVPTSVYVSQGEPGGGPGYGRNENPGWAAVESALAAIEGPGARAVTFASGQAASMALMLALAEGRETIVFPVRRVLQHAGARRAGCGRTGPAPWRLTCSTWTRWRRALRAGPAVLWAETPTNPLLRVADLTALARGGGLGGGTVRRGQHGGDGAAAEATRLRGGGVGVLADQVGLRALGRARRRGRHQGRRPGRRGAAPGGPTAARSPARSRAGSCCAA